MELIEGILGVLPALANERRRGIVTYRDEFVRVYEQNRADVFRYVLTLRIEPAVAQDITQETFLKLYVALRKGAVHNQRAWLFTVAHHMAIDQHRERGSTENADSVLDVTYSSAPSPEQQMIDGERSKRLETALGELSPQQINCLNLRAEGFRYREIAEIVGISSSTVGEFLRRAIVRLRRALYE
ncbi:MAG: sigma-70 family RNA polymerase sigma factor [Bryobacteraceae bacterium]|nr:sigma-70 family RNA polymerase sigma factor [Bryobacteraceae bacterium]